MWKPPLEQNGDIVSYAIKLLQGSQVVMSMILSASELEYPLSNLDPFTNYSVSVNASTSVGPGDAVSVDFSTVIGG